MVRNGGNPNIKNYGFGSRPKSVDDEYRKRTKGVPKTRWWTDERIAQQIDEMLTLYKKILLDNDKIEKNDNKKLKQETIMDMNTMMRRLLEFKEKYYPPVQKSINLNIDTTIEKIINKTKEEYLRKQGYVVVEGESEGEEEDDEN